MGAEPTLRHVSVSVPAPMGVSSIRISVQARTTTNLMRLEVLGFTEVFISVIAGDVFFDSGVLVVGFEANVTDLVVSVRAG